MQADGHSGDTPPVRVADFLSRFGVEWVYHFTDAVNLPSIHRYGLVPHAFLHSRNWDPQRTGGSHSSHIQDARSGLDHCVHLSFVPDHPMAHVAQREGRINNLVWVGVSSEVLFWRGVQGCRTLANTAGAPVLPIEEALDSIDLTALFAVDSSVLVRKAQILVPMSIPPRRLRIPNGS